MPQLNWKIDLGHVLTIVVLLITGAMAYGRLQTDLEYVKHQLSRLESLPERVVRVETLVSKER